MTISSRAMGARSALAAGIVCIVLGVASSANAATYLADWPYDTNDDNPGDGQCADRDGLCSLRAAIEESNSTPWTVHLIDLVATTYFLTRGELVVSGNQIIRGISTAQTFVQPGSGLIRVFNVQTSGTIDFINLTIQNGQPQGPVQVHLGGGLLVSSGTARLYSSRVSNSEATAGGGIYVDSGARLDLQNVEVSGNRTLLTATSGGINWTGGGLNVAQGAWAFIWNSTFFGNEGQIGGALFNSGYVEISNSTLSGNTSRSGGGAIFQGFATASETYVRFSTITNNRCNTAPSAFSNQGGGLYLYAGSMQVGSSIVAGNFDGRGSGSSSFTPDCGTNTTTLWSGGFNLIGTTGNHCAFSSWTGDDIGTPSSPRDARLDPLANYGGVTPTHLPKVSPMSPAIDTNTNTDWWFSCADVFSSDQRSSWRPTDGDGNGSAICDKGAVER